MPHIYLVAEWCCVAAWLVDAETYTLSMTGLKIINVVRSVNEFVTFF